MDQSLNNATGIAPPCAEAWATAKLIAELRARVEALEVAVNAQPETTISSHHRGHAATVYREGFHAGYKHALACVSRSWSQAGIEVGEAGIQRKALIHFESFADTFEGAGGDADLIFRALKSTLDPS